MKRVFETTGGLIVVEYWDAEFGEVTAFDARGWQMAHADWDDDDLAEQLTSIAGLPESEAAALANDILKGYDLRPREQDESVLGTLAGFAAVLIGLGTLAAGAVTVVRFVLDRV